eukprot:gene11246-11395_t
MVAHKSFSVRAPAHLARPVITTRTNAVPFELIAAAGDVEAPVAVPLVAALVVTAAVTFAVPAFLNRGQQAADKIFSAQKGKPLDKKAPAGEVTKQAYPTAGL